MFGLGTWEIILILVAALIFIGPDKLPQVARTIGKGMRQVRSAMSQVDTQARRAVDDFVNAEDPAPDDGAAGEDDEDDHPILRAPPGSPKMTPPASPAEGSDVATDGDAPGDAETDHAGDAATSNAPPRDWHAHVQRPVEGRVAAARPTGRRPSTVVEDPGDDAADGDDVPKDGEPK